MITTLVIFSAMTIVVGLLILKCIWNVSCTSSPHKVREGETTNFRSTLKE